ncbi:MAG: hypothetical protein IT226_14635 [Flavobacteriales bacterium]|nr:hypothetical protein [Flavobacteriales bacterium]
MKTVAFLFFSVASSVLHAQRMDTTETKNGQYGVFQRDRNGTAQNPMAVYDTTGMLLSHISYKHGLLHGPVIHFDSLGRKTWTLEYRKGRRQGPEIYFYPDGSVMVSQWNRNGVIHGPCTTYHPNGQVEWTKAYRDGKLHGERILRDPTGALANGESISYFPLDRGRYITTCINGRPQGKMVATLKNGQVGYSGNYKNGFPDGEFIFFAPDGGIWRKEYYVMGKFQRSTQRGDNGGPAPTQDP